MSSEEREEEQRRAEILQRCRPDGFGATWPGWMVVAWLMVGHVAGGLVLAALRGGL